MPEKSMILLFVRAPEGGRIKTRLAKDLGERAALTVYRLFVSDILETLKRGSTPFTIWFSPPGVEAVMRGWLGEDLQYRGQTGGDLGERMENAFIESFREGHGRVVIIGSDIPDLTAAVVEEAFSSLDTNDAVIGPASDGGYYLIGFRREGLLRQAFHGMPWGSGHVFLRTMQVLEEWGRRIHLLPEWRDIDTVDDLESLYRGSGGTGFRDSRTAFFLEENKERLFPSFRREGLR